MPSACFPTAIGECTLTWSDAGLAGFALPADPQFPPRSVARERNDPSIPASVLRSVARERNDPSFPALLSQSTAHRSPPSGNRQPPSVLRPPSSAVCPPSSALRPPPSAVRPPSIAAVIARVQRHLTGELQDFADLAYDWSHVTEFQRRVLRAVLAVKSSRTATYGELARALGAKPGAARAIGGAVGANPWPLLIPCHRILGAGGRLTGYSAPGGIKTKAALLALEGVELAG